jgi:hypothetical protein
VDAPLESALRDAPAAGGWPAAGGPAVDRATRVGLGVMIGVAAGSPPDRVRDSGAGQSAAIRVLAATTVVCGWAAALVDCPGRSTVRWSIAWVTPQAASAVTPASPAAANANRVPRPGTRPPSRLARTAGPGNSRRSGSTGSVMGTVAARITRPASKGLPVRAGV